MTGTVRILRGDARSLPLPDASVDLICTSPPYFGLRSYSDNGGHYDGQIGSEATPAAYIAALLACTREWMRVLKPSGSMFVNLGDKYSLNNRGSGYAREKPGKGRELSDKPLIKRDLPWPEKCLMGLPWRYALGCVDDLGLILRRDIIWSKPNGLPESVTDRCRSSHEYLFHLVKQPRYFSAVDEIRESYGPNTHAGRSDGLPSPATSAVQRTRPMGAGLTQLNGDLSGRNPLGKLPGSVWDIPSQPLTVPAHLGIDHFAAFPMELPRRIILGWSPSGICVECGEGRRPVADQDRRVLSGSFGRYADAHGADGRTGARKAITSTITGYACACPDATAPTRPALVVDPFGGTGTTALVASVLGRDAVTMDMSADYCRLAAWRTTDPGERARALGVPKPPPVPDGQGDLFEAVS